MNDVRFLVRKVREPNQTDHVIGHLVYCYYKCSVALPHCIGLQYMIVVVPDHSHLLLNMKKFVCA